MLGDRWQSEQVLWHRVLQNDDHYNNSTVQCVTLEKVSVRIGFGEPHFTVLKEYFYGVFSTWPQQPSWDTEKRVSKDILSPEVIPRNKVPEISEIRLSVTPQDAGRLAGRADPIVWICLCAKLPATQMRGGTTKRCSSIGCWQDCSSSKNFAIFPYGSHQREPPLVVSLVDFL